MAEETAITLTGNVVDDPELKFLPSSGAAVVKFRVASTPRYFDKQSSTFKDGEPLFLGVSAWRQMAENVSEAVSKGCRVVIVGRLKQRTYETREGEKRTVFEVEADEVAVSLKFATATVKRMSRSGGGDTGSDQRGNASSSRPDDPWAGEPPPF